MGALFDKILHYISKFNLVGVSRKIKGFKILNNALKGDTLGVFASVEKHAGLDNRTDKASVSGGVCGHYIVAENGGDEEYLSLYDILITSGKTLYEGRVYQ